MGTRYEGDIPRILWWTKGTNHVYWCTPRKAIGTCFGAFCCMIVLDHIFCRVLYGPRAVHGFILRTKNQRTKGTNDVYWSTPRKAIGTCFGAFCCMIVLDHIFCRVLYGPRAVHGFILRTKNQRTKGTNDVYWSTPRKAIGTCFGAFCCMIVFDPIFCRVLYGPRAVHVFFFRTKNQWNQY